MVTTGAEMPILNGINSAAVAAAGAAQTVRAKLVSARPRQAAVLRNMPISMASSLQRVLGSIELSAHNGLGTGIAAVNRAPVAIGPHVLLDQAPDTVFDLVETRLAFHLQPAR